MAPLLTSIKKTTLKLKSLEKVNDSTAGVDYQMKWNKLYQGERNQEITLLTMLPE